MPVGLKYYYHLLSQPSRSLYIILKHCGIPFEACIVDLTKGEQFSDEFKKVNRFQKVPCIVEGDLKLAESIAILRYLQSTGRIPESLYPTDAEGCARVNEFLNWQHLTIRREGFVYFRSKWIEPLFTGIPAPEGKLAKLRDKFEKQLDILENVWLASSKFVAGDKMTVADIFGVCEIQQSKMTEYDVRRKYPKTAEWIENVRQQTNPVFDEAHAEVYRNISSPVNAKL